MSDLQKWIASFVLTVILVVICYLWIDRPVALLAHETQFGSCSSVRSRAEFQCWRLHWQERRCSCWPCEQSCGGRSRALTWSFCYVR